MNKLFHAVALAGSLILVSACDPVPKVKSPSMPDFKSPGIPDFSKLYATCDKKDLKFSDEAKRNKIVITDTIENQEVETLDCNNKLVSKVKKPVHPLSKTLEIKAPDNLKDSVTYVMVENFRTCAVNTIDTQARKTEIEVDGKKIAVPNLKNVDSTGKVSITLTDSKLRDGLTINVSDNDNLLKITYFGKCQKYKEPKDRNVTQGDAFNCLEATLLGTQEIWLFAHIERPDTAAPAQVKECKK